MNSNRIAGFWGNEGGVSVMVAEMEPRTSFMACPAGLVLAPWQHQLYQAAYAKALALVAPWPPRQIWN